MIRRIALSWAVLTAVLFLSLQAQSQFIGEGVWKKVVSGFSPSCTASTNWLARATNVTLTVDKQNYDNLLCGLNTDGVLTSLDALYVYAAPDSATALLNLVQNAFNSTTTGTVSFSAYHGFTGDGSTFFIDTGLKPSTGGTNYVQNSASTGAYVLTSNASTANYIAIGTGNAFNSYLALQTSFGQALYFVNGGTNGAPAIANTQGFWVSTRTAASGAGAISLYNFKTSSSAIDATNSTSGGLDNVNIYVFAANEAPAVAFSNAQMSAAFIGTGLNATAAGHLSTRLNTFMTAYSINVY
jgi:hypothetical protein